VLQKIVVRWGFAPDPLGELTALPLAGFKGPEIFLRTGPAVFEFNVLSCAGVSQTDRQKQAHA